MMKLKKKTDGFIPESGKFGGAEFRKLTPEKFYGTRVLPVHAADKMQQRTFSRSGNACDSDHFSLVRFQRKAGQNLKTPAAGHVVFLQIAYFE